MFSGPDSIDFKELNRPFHINECLALMSLAETCSRRVDDEKPTRQYFKRKASLLAAGAESLLAAPLWTVSRRALLPYRNHACRTHLAGGSWRSHSDHAFRETPQGQANIWP